MSHRENEDEEGGVDLENNEEPTPGIGPQLGGDETGKMKAQLCSKGEECSDKIPKLMELDCNPGFRVCNSDCSTKEVAWKYEYDFDEDSHEEEEEAEESEENKVFDDVEEERGMGENDFVADGREVEMEGDADSMSPSLSSASKEISAETAIGTKIIRAEICQADNEGSVDDIDELKTQGEISGRLGFGEKNFLQGNQKKDLGGVDGEAKAESIGGTIQGKMGPESENLNEEAKQIGETKERNVGEVVLLSEDIEGEDEQLEENDDVDPVRGKKTEKSKLEGGGNVEELAEEPEEGVEMLLGESVQMLESDETKRLEKDYIDEKCTKLGGLGDDGTPSMQSVNCEEKRVKPEKVASEQVERRDMGSGKVLTDSEDINKSSSVDDAYKQWRLPWLGSQTNHEKSTIEIAMSGKSIQVPKIVEVIEKTRTVSTKVTGEKQKTDASFSRTSKTLAVATGKEVLHKLKAKANIKFAEIKGKGITIEEKFVCEKPPGKMDELSKTGGNGKASKGRQDYDDSSSSWSESETSEDEISSASDNGGRDGWEDPRIGSGRHYPTFPPPPYPLQPPPSPPQSYLPVVKASPVSYSRQHLGPQDAPAWLGSSTMEPGSAVPRADPGVLSAAPVSYWPFSTPPPPLHQPPPNFHPPPIPSHHTPLCTSFPLPSSQPSAWQSSPMPSQVQSKTSPSPLGSMFIQSPRAASPFTPRRSSTPAPSSMISRMFQLSGTPLPAPLDPCLSPIRQPTLAGSPAHIHPPSPTQVCSAAEYWRRHKEQEQKVEEERLQQEKALIMREAQRFVEQRRAAEAKKALALKKWVAGEKKEDTEEKPTEEEQGLLAQQNVFSDEKGLGSQNQLGSTREGDISQQKMLAQAKVMADEMWIAEQKKAAQEKKKAVEAEEKRIAEENYKKLADEKWRIDLERLAELQKLADEKKVKKLADEQRAMEEKRLAEERRRSEDKQSAVKEDAGEKRLEENKLEVESKLKKKPQFLMDLSTSAGLEELLRLAGEDTLVEEKKFAFEGRSFSFDDSSEDEEEIRYEEESLNSDRRLEDERLVAEEKDTAPGEYVIGDEEDVDLLAEREINFGGSLLGASLSADFGVMSEDDDGEGGLVPGSEKTKRKAEASKLEELGRKRLRLEERRAEIGMKMEALKVAGIY